MGARVFVVLWAWAFLCVRVRQGGWMSRGCDGSASDGCYEVEVTPDFRDNGGSVGTALPQGGEDSGGQYLCARAWDQEEGACGEWRWLVGPAGVGPGRW